MALLDKMSLTLTQRALAHYLPLTRTEIVRISSPYSVDAVRVWFSADFAQDYFISGGSWHQIYAQSFFEVPAFDLRVGAGSGQQTISAVIAADIGRWLRPHVFPLSADQVLHERAEEAPQRLAESVRFLRALAQGQIAFTDRADQLAETLIDQIMEQIDESRAESQRPLSALVDEPPATSAPGSAGQQLPFGEVARAAGDILLACGLNIGVRWGAQATDSLPAERVLVEVWGVPDFLVLARGNRLHSCSSDPDVTIDEQVDLGIEYFERPKLLAMAIASQIVRSWVGELHGVPFSDFGDHRTAYYTFFRPVTELLRGLEADTDPVVASRAKSLSSAVDNLIASVQPHAPS